MPPKKRKPVIPSKPGRMRQYLLDNFQVLPGACRSLTCKNGHVLLIHLENGSSITKTQEIVSDLFAIRPTHSQVTSLLSKSIDTFKNLSRDTERQKFENICEEVFRCHPAPSATAPNPDSALPPEVLHPQLIPIPSPSVSNPTSPPVHLTTPQSGTSSLTDSPFRHLRCADVLTPRKVKLKKRLIFISKTKADMQKKYKDNIMKLKQKMWASPYQNRVLKQSLERKKSTIGRLRENLHALKKQQASGKTLIMGEIKKKNRSLKLKRKERRALGDMQRELEELRKEITEKNAAIRTLENEKCLLEEQVGQEASTKRIKSKKDKKTFSGDMRMMVFDAVTREVPTRSIPELLKKFADRAGIFIEGVPHRNTVEQMTRELGVIADLHAAEVLTKQSHLTLAFDATTQEGVHVNCIHVTTETSCHVLAIDQLAGGTAEDYFNHVSATVDNLAKTFSDFHKQNYVDCRKKIIENISNTMTDRAAVNHATVARINEAWDKSLNELNCHLHPLDTIASSCRRALKGLECDRSHLFGTDCLAGKIVLAMNKLRYKDGKGDPKGFVTFLRDHGLPTGLLPRYRGNRLHVLFHICAQLVTYHNLFLGFLTTSYITCGGLRDGLHHDLSNPKAIQEICALALVGKLLSAPWMQAFYTSAEKQIDHIQGIQVVKGVMEEIGNASKNPLGILRATQDFFKNDIPKEDKLIHAINNMCPADESLRDMLVACLSATLEVLTRQYSRYFQIEDTEQLRAETSSARTHNIDAEEMVGMFSAAQLHAPNATLCFLSAKLRAKKNKVVDHLDGMGQAERNRVLEWAVTRARCKRQENRRRIEEVRQDISRRVAVRRQKKEETERKKIEQTLKISELEDLQKEFPDIEKKALADLHDIISGTAVGRNLCHLWYDMNTQDHTTYFGRIEKVKKRNKTIYVVAYWKQKESYEDAVDFDLSKFQLGADVVCGDLMLA